MGASGCYQGSCLKRRRNGGFVVVARVAVMGFALDSLARLRMLYGVDSVLDAVRIAALALVDFVPCIEVVRLRSAYLVAAV